MSGGRIERGRERIPSRLCAVRAEPDTGLDPVNCEIKIGRASCRERVCLYV